MTFWNDLAKECQEEFKRFGTEGKCIEARELIIALPEEYTKFDPNQVLREFTEQFKKRYDVECVSALHHNKTKKNYHNAARQDWNRTADMALVSGIEESKIIEIRNEHVYWRNREAPCRPRRTSRSPASAPPDRQL